MKYLIAVSLILSWSLLQSVACAESIFAECTEPTGWTVVIANGKESSSKDKITGVHPSFLWKAGQDRATVVMRGGKRLGGPESYDAIVVPSTKRMVSFIAHFEAGLEVYSLFLDTGLLIMSSHKDLSSGIPSDSTLHQLFSGKILTAKCKINSGPK